MSEFEISSANKDYSKIIVSGITKDKNSIQLFGNFQNVDPKYYKTDQLINSPFYKEIKSQIHDLFVKIQLPMRTKKGTKYLMDAIVIAYCNDSSVFGGLYPLFSEVSKIYNIDYKKIEWNITNLLRTYIPNKDLLYSTFSFNGSSYYDGRSPLSIKYFISLCIEYLYYLNK